MLRATTNEAQGAKTMRMFAFLVVLLAGPAFAAEEIDSSRSRARSDRVLTGERVEVKGATSGDLISAGGEVTIDAATEGDLITFGGDVNIAGSAKDDAYVVGGEVTITSDISGNLRVAGGEVRIENPAKIAGNASVAGGEVQIAGTIGGDLRVFGGEVLLDGVVEGDVEATAGEIALGPNARIKGKLAYASRNDLQRDPAAEVGSVERDDWPRQEADVELEGLAFIWTMGLGVAALLMLGIAPGFAARTTDAVAEQFVQSLLMGLVGLVATPIVAALLAITVIGLPLALILLFAYPALLMLGYLFGVIAMADIALQKIRPIQVTDRGLRMLAAIGALALIAAVGRLPVAGGLVNVIVLLLGTGALLLQLRSRPRVAA
jgi:cytoskeletal protein CcmA (bactofilin family)